jgi:hypothetical protein
LEHGTTLTSQFLLFVSCCMHACERASRLSPGACNRGGERARPSSWFSGVVAWDTEQRINSWASMEKNDFAAHNDFICAIGRAARTT